MNLECFLSLEFIRRYHCISRLSKLSKSNIVVLGCLETTIMNVHMYTKISAATTSSRICREYDSIKIANFNLV